MAADFNKVASELLGSEAGEKFASKKNELNSIIGSKDGQKVKQMLEGGESNILDAVKKGDMDTLKNALSGILKTEEGSRMAEQIMKVIK